MQRLANHVIDNSLPYSLWGSVSYSLRIHTQHYENELARICLWTRKGLDAVNILLLNWLGPVHQCTCAPQPQQAVPPLFLDRPIY